MSILSFMERDRWFDVKLTRGRSGDETEGNLTRRTGCFSAGILGALVWLLVVAGDIRREGRPGERRGINFHLNCETRKKRGEGNCSN